MRFIGPTVAIALAGTPAHAQPVAPLPEAHVSATLTLEEDASADRFADVGSIAPDLAVGATDYLTLMLIHSTVGRTGFRGSAGSGLCVTDACAHAYDNVGLEALYALHQGALAVSANPGVHATSLDREHYVAKLGVKLRYKVDRVTLVTLPSVSLALSHREDAMPNRDRMWLPVSAMVGVAGGLALGIGTGFKAPFDDVGGAYEIAGGVIATYTTSPMLSFGASWVHGKLLGGDAVLPDDMSGVDSRALQLWVTLTQCAFGC